MKAVDDTVNAKRLGLLLL